MPLREILVIYLRFKDQFISNRSNVAGRRTARTRRGGKTEQCTICKKTSKRNKKKLRHKSGDKSVIFSTNYSNHGFHMSPHWLTRGYSSSWNINFIFQNFSFLRKIVGKKDKRTNQISFFQPIKTFFFSTNQISFFRPIRSLLCSQSELFFSTNTEPFFPYNPVQLYWSFFLTISDEDCRMKSVFQMKMKRLPTSILLYFSDESS